MPCIHFPLCHVSFKSYENTYVYQKWLRYHHSIHTYVIQTFTMFVNIILSLVYVPRTLLFKWMAYTPFMEGVDKYTKYNNTNILYSKRIRINNIKPLLSLIWDYYLGRSHHHFLFQFH